MTNVKDAARGLSASVKKEKEEEQRKVVKDVAQTKVVVRRLPPTLTAETFVEQVSPLPPYDYFNFVPAGKSADKSLAFSRVYLRFVQYSDVFLFKEKFDGYEFIDSRGNVYPAVVEFAPYQRVPKRAKKPDPKMNSIDQDPDYKKFLEMLEKNDRPRVPTLQELLQQVEASKGAEAVVNSETPLLAFIKRKREEKKKQLEKQREERVRELERKKAREDEERLRRRHQLEKEQHQATAAKDQRRQGSATSSTGTAAAATAAGDRAKKATTKDEEKDVDRQYDKPGDSRRTVAADVRGPHSSGDSRWQKPGSQPNPSQHQQQPHQHHHQATSADKVAPARPSSSGPAAKSTPAKGAAASAGGEAKAVHAAPPQYGAKTTVSTPGGGSNSNRPVSAKDRTAGESVAVGSSAAPGGKSVPGPPASFADRPASKEKPNSRRPADDYHPAPTPARPSSSSRRSAAPAGAAGSVGSKPAAGTPSSATARKDVQPVAKSSLGSSSSSGGAAVRAGSEGASDACDTRHALGAEGSGAASGRESRGSSEEANAAPAAGARRSVVPASAHGVPHRGDDVSNHPTGADLVVTKSDDAGHEDKPRASSSGNTRRDFQQKTRYKERPERAIYDPAQRAAERRQKQAVRGSDGQPSAAADAKD